MEESHGIIIIGGGICGLATALALHRKGIASLVLEKSETLRADGTAIGVHVNGWRVLEQLGVAAELRETANLITAYHNVWQQESKSSLVPVRKELRCLKRKDLVETLAKNMPAGAIRFGCHIAVIHADPGNHGAVLATVDGTTMRAKVLIGCDGTNSVVAKYLGLVAPKPIPRTFLRGFTWYPHRHPFGTEFLRLRGKDFFVGRLPVTDNLVHFFISMPNPSTGITKDAVVMKELALEKLQDCPAEITGMVQDSDPESLNVVNKVWYRPPWQVAFSAFQRGSVTVAGDAMHAMGPSIGQGGASGLENAVVLARSLSRAVAAPGRSLDVDEGAGTGRELCEKTAISAAAAALAEYVRERRPRAARLCLESFVVGMLVSTRSLITRLACVAILAILGTESLRHTDYDCGRL